MITRACLSFLDNRAKLCLIKGVEPSRLDRLEFQMEFFTALTDGDRLAIGIILGIIGTLGVAFIRDWAELIIAERSSAREYDHWKTTIRETDSRSLWED